MSCFKQVRNWAGATYGEIVRSGHVWSEVGAALVICVMLTMNENRGIKSVLQRSCAYERGELGSTMFSPFLTTQLALRASDFKSNSDLVSHSPGLQKLHDVLMATLLCNSETRRAFAISRLRIRSSI
jgi:hypothetical protein